MRENRNQIINRNVIKPDIGDVFPVLTVRHHRHTIGQRIQGRGGLAHGKCLKHLPAAQHQDNQRCGQIFTKGNTGGKGQDSQKIRPEITLKHLADNFDNQYPAAQNHNNKQRHINQIKPHHGPQGKCHQNKMQHHANNSQNQHSNIQTCRRPSRLTLWGFSTGHIAFSADDTTESLGSNTCFREINLS